MMSWQYSGMLDPGDHRCTNDQSPRTPESPRRVENAIFTTTSGEDRLKDDSAPNETKARQSDQ